MDDNELRKMFPNLTPGSSAPAMFRLNGCGLALYGSRDHHEPSNTYVSTYCISILFIPVIALKAYRISDAPSGGWYFLGSEPLSTFAKTWNALLASFIMSLIAFGAYEAHTTSPQYRAKVNMAKAEAFIEEGKLKEAAEKYKLVATSRAHKREEALQKMEGLIEKAIEKGNLQQAAQIFRVLFTTEKYDYPGKAKQKEFWEKGIALIEGPIGKDLKAAQDVLNTIKVYAPKPENFEEQRLKLLERQIKSDPHSVAAVTELTTILEKRGETGRCIKLLEPLASKLGTTDGARILGTFYLDQGREDEALPIIEPYVTAAVKEITKKNKEYNDKFKMVFNQKKNTLTSGRAYGFDYRKYKKADSVQKSALVNRYLFMSIAQDTTLKKSREAYNQACKAVPLALKEAEIRSNKNDFKRVDFILTNIEKSASKNELYKKLRERADKALGK